MSIQLGPPNKKNRSREEISYKNRGNVSESNVKWAYNFDPLKKWGLLLLSAAMFASAVIGIMNEYLNKETKKVAQVEAKAEYEKFLERRLETVKKNYIEEEGQKITLPEKTRTIKPVNTAARSEQKIYTWINEDGNRVYSNKPKTKDF